MVSPEEGPIQGPSQDGNTTTRQEETGLEGRLFID
jgi:hypothetical protein